MSEEEFFEFWAGLFEAVGARDLEDAHCERAIGYPWGSAGFMPGD